MSEKLKKAEQSDCRLLRSRVELGMARNDSTAAQSIRYGEPGGRTTYIRMKEF